MSVAFSIQLVNPSHEGNKLRSPCARDRVGTATGTREGAELLFGALELCVGEVATEAN